MIDREALILGSAENLRRAFDRSFAEAVRDDVTRFEDLLAIGVGGEAFAVRVSEIAGLFVDRKITALPSAVPEFLGIAGFRGAIVPVYDLGALLGYPLSQDARWLVHVVSGSTIVGLAFDEVGGYLRVESTAFAPRGDASVREIVRTETGSRPVIHLASLLEAIERRAHHDGV